MTVYMVERNLPGITNAQLVAAQEAAIATAYRFTNKGNPVRYIRSTFVPAESLCMCLFEAANAETVEEVNEEAQIPFSRVVEVIELNP